MQWSSHQEAVFNFVTHGSGNAVVEAVAGAGKTTTLVEAVRRMQGNVFLGAFNKKMADELKERVANEQGVQAGTFHSAGFRQLNRSLRKRIQVDDKKLKKLAEQLIEEKQRPEMEQYISFAVAAASMAKQRAIGFLCSLRDSQVWWEMVDHFGINDELPESASADDQSRAIRFAQCLLQRSTRTTDTIDFDDMVYLPLMLDIRMFPNDWVLVDEAQDTNPARRALAKKMLKPSGRLIAVGDPHQAIFGFTGADNDALGQIREEFGACTLPLHVTYRCPKTVVAHAQQWVSHIQAADSAPEGEVLYRTLDLSGEHDSNSVVTPEQFTHQDAILCRYNKPLVDLAFKLIRQGVACRIEGRDIGEQLVKLANRWKVKKLDTLRTRLENYRDREVQKAQAKGKEEQADRVQDRVETMYVLIERAEEKGLDKDGLISMIRDMFGDNVAGLNLLTLCSVHKAKGMEWPTVYLLNRDGLMPSKFARQQWQMAQETNLIYVAVTRAQRTLVELSY